MEIATISIEKDSEFIKYLMKLKLIDYKTLRDIEIKREYEESQKLETQKLKGVREMLADKYFLSEKCIETILYDKGETKNKILLINLKLSRMTTITLEK